MMKQEEILKKTGQIIDDLKDQHQYLTQTQNYNLLELELFTANADFLIDHIEILKKLQLSKNQNNEATVVESKSTDDNLTIAPKIEASIKNETTNFVRPAPDNLFALPEKPEEMMFEFEQNIEVGRIFDRELTADETKLLQEKQDLFAKLNAVNTSLILPDVANKNIVLPAATDGAESEEIPELEAKNEEETLPLSSKSETQTTHNIIENETIDDKKITLNQFLSNQNNAQNISSRLSNMATADLKSAISLNDKMIFIKELFNGYNLAYSEALEILNRFDSFESADNFLQKNYALKNKWVDKQEVVDRFYEVLNRRYVK
jgi:hypothetical protein